MSEPKDRYTIVQRWVVMYEDRPVAVCNSQAGAEQARDTICSTAESLATKAERWWSEMHPEGGDK